MPPPWGRRGSSTRSLLGLMVNFRKDVETVHVVQVCAPRRAARPAAMASDGAGIDPAMRCFRDLRAKTLPCAADRELAAKVPRSMATLQGRVQPLSGTLAPIARNWRRHPRRLRRRPAKHARLLSRTTSRRASPMRLPFHAALRRTTNLLEPLCVGDRPRLKISISQRLRREAGAQAHVRRAHPRRRTLARPALHRVRAAPVDILRLRNRSHSVGGEGFEVRWRWRAHAGRRRFAPRLGAEGPSASASHCSIGSRSGCRKAVEQPERGVLDRALTLPTSWLGQIVENDDVAGA